MGRDCSVLARETRIGLDWGRDLVDWASHMMMRMMMMMMMMMMIKGIIVQEQKSGKFFPKLILQLRTSLQKPGAKHGDITAAALVTITMKPPPPFPLPCAPIPKPYPSPPPPKRRAAPRLAEHLRTARQINQSEDIDSHPGMPRKRYCPSANRVRCTILALSVFEFGRRKEVR